MFRPKAIVCFSILAALGAAVTLIPVAVQAQGQGQGGNPLNDILAAVTKLSATVTAEFTAVKNQMTAGFNQTAAGLNQANSSLTTLSGQVSGSRPLSNNRTVLMIPFVSNQAGFDTGIAITNTTLDPLGTTPMSGFCSINYYSAGTPRPAQHTNAKVVPGDSVAFTLSGGGNYGIAATPGFQGYIIAVCDFPGAHGFALMTGEGQPYSGQSVPVHVIAEPRNLTYAETLGQ